MYSIFLYIGCPYFASRVGVKGVAASAEGRSGDGSQGSRGSSSSGDEMLVPESDIVFCPYNYILNPSIRETMG